MRQFNSTLNACVPDGIVQSMRTEQANAVSGPNCNILGRLPERAAGR